MRIFILKMLPFIIRLTTFLLTFQKTVHIFTHSSDVSIPCPISRYILFSLYRWHICDPIYFKKDIRVTIQALGWRDEGRYLPLQDDISSVCFWYQDSICNSFPKFPGVDELEIIQVLINYQLLHVSASGSLKCGPDYFLQISFFKCIFV